MKRFKIKNISGEIIFSAECVSLADCAALALQKGCNEFEKRYQKC